MKKILLLTAFAFIAYTSTAQITFGVTGGINFANISQNFADEEDEDDTMIRIAPRVGVAVDYSLSDLLSVRSGIVYSSKGSKQESSESEEFMGETYSMESKSTLAINYLEIPITAIITTGDIEITAGPYVAFGIGGKYEYEMAFSGGGNSDSDSGSGVIGFTNEISESQRGDDKAYVKPFDAGINIGVGYKVGPGVASLNFIKGLANAMPKRADDPDFDPADHKLTNTVFSLSYTYLFNNQY